MPRYTHTRVPSRSVLGKRGRSGLGVRPFKRRRVVSRRRRSTNWTSQSGVGGGVRFRARRLSRTRWRRMLWNNTLQKDHYRSVNAFSVTFNTPATVSTMSVVNSPALRLNTSNFYVAGGGAVAPDSAQALPVFTGKIVIRGGVIGLRMANVFDTTDASRSTIQGFAYLIRTSRNYSSANLPTSATLGWDPSLIQDFATNVGRVVYRKSFLLRDADTSVIEYRLRTMEVDPGDYISDKNQYVWVIMAGNVDILSARSFYYTAYYNISFSADAV